MLVLIGGSGVIAIVAGYNSGGSGLNSGHPNLIVSYRGFGVGSRSGSTMVRFNR